jgi:hypothetical protein
MSSVYKKSFDITDVSADGRFALGMHMTGRDDHVPLVSDLWILDLSTGRSYA